MVAWLAAVRQRATEGRKGGGMEVQTNIYIYFIYGKYNAQYTHTPGRRLGSRPNKTPHVAFPGFRSVSLILSGLQVELFGGRSILARKWLAKMTKTRQNENENFQTMTNRDDS